MRTYLIEVFEKIAVYPTAFYSTITEDYHKGEFNPKLKTIVFSWEDFLLGDIVTNDNINLGIHEFMHALTFHGSTSNDASANIFYDAFKIVTKVLQNPAEVRQLKSTNYFRSYAFENPLEFASVVTEHFFESPKELKKHFPKLYEKLVRMLNYSRIEKHVF